MSTAADWSQEELALCLKLRGDGRSTAEIGRELGRSKNSVIGIIHRNRDLFPVTAPEKQTDASRQKAEARKTVEARLRHHMTTTTRRPVFERPPVLPTAPIVEMEPEIVAAPPVAFAQVTDRQCKWPLWPIAENPGPAGLCCGTEIELGVVYCGHHRRLSRGAGTRSERTAEAALERMG